MAIPQLLHKIDDTRYLPTYLHHTTDTGNYDNEAYYKDINRLKVYILLYCKTNGFHRRHLFLFHWRWSKFRSLACQRFSNDASGNFRSRPATTSCWIVWFEDLATSLQSGNPRNFIDDEETIIYRESMTSMYVER